MQLALREGEHGPAGERPEAGFERRREAEFRAANVRAGVLAGSVAAIGLLAWLALGRRFKGSST